MASITSGVILLPVRPLPTPDAIEWVVVDRNHVSTEYEPVLDEIMTGGEFEVVLDESGVVVARRISD